MTEKKLNQYEKSWSQDHTTRSPQYAFENIMGRFLRFEKRI